MVEISASRATLTALLSPELDAMTRRAASLLGGRLRALVQQPEPQASLANATGAFATGGRTQGIAQRIPSAASQTRAAALPAQEVAHRHATDLPLTRVDSVGAISIISKEELDFVPTVYENVDGRRIEDGRYAAFIKDISGAWFRRACVAAGGSLPRAPCSLLPPPSPCLPPCRH